MNQRAEKVACGHSVVTYSCPDVNNERKDGFSAQPRNLSLVSHVEMRHTNHLDLPQDWSKNNSRETLATSKQKKHSEKSLANQFYLTFSSCVHTLGCLTPPPLKFHNFKQLTISSSDFHFSCSSGA